MVACIICGGRGFTLYNGLCNECYGTGVSDSDYDTIVFEDETEYICTDEQLECMTLQYLKLKYKFL